MRARLRWKLLSSLCLLLGTACDGTACDDHSKSSNTDGKAAGKVSAADDEFVAPDSRGWGRAGGVEYLEVVKGDAEASTPLPLAIFLHGFGAGAEDVWIAEATVPMRVVMFQSPRKYKSSFTWMYSPVGDGESAWLAHTVKGAGEELAHAVQVFTAHRPTRGRVILAGFSQGAVVTYYVALRYPQLVHGAVPIAGLLPKSLWPDEPASAPPFPIIRAIHGEHDDAVSTAVDRATVAHLVKLGQPASLHVYSGMGHQLAPAMRKEMEDYVNKFAREIVGAP